jgi:Skp family chaperone for outer membrane proteins
MTKGRFALIAAVFAAVLALAGSANAGEPGGQKAGMQIAVVRIHEIFDRYEYTADMQKTIEEELRPDQEEIEQKKKEIRGLKEELQSTRVISPDTYAWFVKMQKIKRLEYFIELRKKDVSKRFNERMVTLYKAFYTRFERAVSIYAERNGYDLVLRAAEPDVRSESFMSVQHEISLKSVPYYAKRLDRTEQILETMNRLYQEEKASAGNK